MSRRELTRDEILDLYAKHEAEIAAIWETLPDECTMKDAVYEWLRRNPHRDPRDEPGKAEHWWLATKIKAALVGRLAWEVLKNLNPFRRRDR